MRFIPRATDVSTLATSLSLAIANYKPIPQLPTQQQLLDLGYGSVHGLSTLTDGNGTSSSVGGASSNISNNSSSNTSNATSFASSLRLSKGQSFQVQSSDSSSSADSAAQLSTHGASLKSNSSSSSSSNNESWGQPSLLFIAQDSDSDSTSSKSNSGNSFASKSGGTIGPGNCPIQDKYTPVGGWDALPAPTFPPFDPVKATAYRYRQQVGVNLGAW